MPEFMDFDKYIAEAKKEAASFQLYGETHTIPPSIPLAVVMQFKALQMRDAHAQVTDDEIFHIFDHIFGAENRTQWQEKGMDIGLMLRLISWAFTVYGVTAPQQRSR